MYIDKLVMFTTYVLYPHNWINIKIAFCKIMHNTIKYYISKTPSRMCRSSGCSCSMPGVFNLICRWDIIIKYMYKKISFFERPVKTYFFYCIFIRSFEISGYIWSTNVFWKVDQISTKDEQYRDIFNSYLSGLFTTIPGLFIFWVYSVPKLISFWFKFII